jgi:aldehyde dehydrogenase (NAD+)
MTFGKMQLNPALSPGVLDTATWDCPSAWRAIVTKPVHGAFVEKILQRVARIRVSDGTSPDATMGPVCGQTQLDSVPGYIQKGIDEGARLAVGGHLITTGGFARGCFIEPTVFTAVTPTMAIAREEIFGPVLAIIEARDFAQALSIANDSEFGLSSSVYTASLAKAMAFVNASEAGLVHVNLPTALKEPQLPFGGIKHSGVGLPEAGQSGIEFFTRHKAVYIKYGEAL